MLRPILCVKVSNDAQPLPCQISILGFPAVGIIVPYNERLLWVIAIGRLVFVIGMQLLNIPVLPHVVNAVQRVMEVARRLWLHGLCSRSRDIHILSRKCALASRNLYLAGIPAYTEPTWV
ncbi:uncharacterized protein EI90DRAFT_3062071 [Cantharellus anzutake]|uniref:uncharacterized protein n=1 Tax=Cantharellus anzutake TaxID=1750568 RepID=UPI0019082231|nr:uncharacterized protein EI90DRAFT_3062071 [Cantharellus anzutake]KAF8329807.1 hypothetical protein EI90DRAFT_3062071 [Cantharellus anzutake]